MEEQTRATLILAAATITAGLVQGHPHSSPESSVETMREILQEMQKLDLVPANFFDAGFEHDEAMPMVVG